VDYTDILTKSSHPPRQTSAILNQLTGGDQLTSTAFLDQLSTGCQGDSQPEAAILNQLTGDHVARKLGDAILNQLTGGDHVANSGRRKPPHPHASCDCHPGGTKMLKPSTSNRHFIFLALSTEAFHDVVRRRTNPFNQNLVFCC